MDHAILPPRIPREEMELPCDHHRGHRRSQRRGLPEILAQTRSFIRTAVVPRENEILATDHVPDDLRQQAEDMGLFGCAIPQAVGAASG